MQSGNSKLFAKRRRWPRRIALTLLALLLLGAGLFTINGLWLASGERAVAGTTAHPPKPPVQAGEVVTVLAWNIAKAFVHEGGLRFAPAEAVRARVREIAEVIRREDADLVFLSETVVECALCPVDQVREIAEGAGMHAWAFGENYNVGFPAFRLRGGNALLSRRPLEAGRNPSLAGRKPFWATENSRRVLLCSALFAGRAVTMAVLHTDSFDLDNNLVQTRQILDWTGGGPAILAGDFNAEPHDDSLRMVRAAERFSGATEGPPTFPTDAPRRRIDYVLAPAAWELLECRVLDSRASDHLAVLSRFRVR